MSDAGAFEQEQPSLDLTRLPEVIDVTVTSVRFEPPRIEYDSTERVTYPGAVAFDVTTSEPFTQRALGPAVFVGDVALHTFDRLDSTRYRFYAFDPSVLEVDAEITVGWPDQEPKDRAPTRVRFEPPEKELPEEYVTE